jgi:hypothetical protein
MNRGLEIYMRKKAKIDEIRFSAYLYLRRRRRREDSPYPSGKRIFELYKQIKITL